MTRPDFHPAAGVVVLKQATVNRLVESIREHGQLISCIRVNGKVFDGRKRVLACEELKVKPRFVDVDLPDDATPEQIAYALNMVREQFTREEMKDAQKLVLKAKPELSNREVAKQTGADHKTVGKVREELEETGEIPQFESKGGRGKKTGEPKPAPVEPRDALGNVIPEPLRLLFADTDIADGIASVDKILRSLEAAAAVIEQAVNDREESHAPYLKPNVIVNALSKAVHELRTAKRGLQDGKPYAVAEGKPGWVPFRA